MNKKLLVILVGIAGSISSTWAADDTKLAETAKISHHKMAVIDMDKVLQGAPQIQRGNEESKKKFNGRDEKLKARFSKFQKEIDDFKKNAPTMSEEQKNKREKELMKEQEELNKDRETIQKEFGEFQSQIIKGFQNDFTRAVTVVAEEKKINIVINSAAVLYKDENGVSNITKDVLGKLK